MHELPLITTIAVGFTTAWFFGLLTQMLRLSPIVGYLLAGVLMGPHTPGFIGDTHLAHQLAEIGVILLMFGVGLHFHLKDLIAVQRIAIPGAIGQIAIAMTATMFLFSFFGMPYSTSAVLGVAMAVASTVVLMRVLMAADLLSSPEGHVAVGWLLVEDIFTVVVLVLIPVLGSAGGESSVGVGTELGFAFAKLGALVLLIAVLGSKIIPWVLVKVARLRSRELFTLTVLVFSIAMAAASYEFFGASMALGAFLAGMVVAQSPVSHQAAADALPMRDAFAVLFFVSVGMLFDPMFVIDQPLLIVAALGIILIVKPLAAMLIVWLLGHSLRTTLTVALGLAQIGEFSFILAELAHKHHLMPPVGQNVLVASAIISITLNPLLFRLLIPIERWVQKRPWLWRILNGRAERRAQRANNAVEQDIHDRTAGGKKIAILVGYGPVGRSVNQLLDEAGLETVIIDFNMDTISALRKEGRAAVFGDASREAILEQAGMKEATHLVLTVPDLAARRPIVVAARNMNPHARILVRAHYLQEREYLTKEGATAAVYEEGEVAVALARLVLANTGTQRKLTEAKVRDLRRNLIYENMVDINEQQVASVMVPWEQVRVLSSNLTQREVLQRVAEFRHSRWPVVEEGSSQVIGYLLIKDLIAEVLNEGNWLDLLRPVRPVHSCEDIESTLHRMQSERATIYLVQDSEDPIGLITLEDILEQLVGRMDDEYSNRPDSPIKETLVPSSIILELQGHTAETVIEEMVHAIPASQYPAEIDIAALVLKREHSLSTDLGGGIAVPHARCSGLAEPILVFGRSSDGIMFTSDSQEVVRLVFLLVTPSEHPELQISLLSQIARRMGERMGESQASELLLHATSEPEVIDILAR